MLLSCTHLCLLTLLRAVPLSMFVKHGEAILKMKNEISNYFIMIPQWEYRMLERSVSFDPDE